jgi:hypothetical protein
MIRTYRAVSALIALALAPSTSASQEVRCILEPRAEASFSGECDTGDRQVLLRLHRPTTEMDALWVGALVFPQGELDVEIAVYQYSDGPSLVIRETVWRELSELSFSEGRLVLGWDASEEAPPSQLDLGILRRAREALQREDLWDRQDDRDCENDGAQVSLYCTLATTTAEVMGRYQHRQPAMQAVRRIIRSEWGDRVVNHRLMDFNNDPRTTLDDVRRLFDLAEAALEKAIR